MAVNWDKVDEAALALMYLTTSVEHHGEARTWKGFAWDILDRMFERGWISDPKRPAKSVVIFDEARHRSQRLFEEQFGRLDEPSQRWTAPDSGARREPAGRCECGCGTTVIEGRDFVPGHDQKLRIELERRAGGLLALRELVGALEQHAEGRTTAEELSAVVQRALAGNEDAGQQGVAADSAERVNHEALPPGNEGP